MRSEGFYVNEKVQGSGTEHKVTGSGPFECSADQKSKHPGTFIL